MTFVIFRTKSPLVTFSLDKIGSRDSAFKTTLEAYFTRLYSTATTSEIKAKLLADDIVPSRHVKVETTDGVVQPVPMASRLIVILISSVW